MTTSMALLLGIALVLSLLNGFQNASTVVATMISSRALSPRKAMLLAAVAEGGGPFVFGVAVAKTIGSDIVTPDSATMELLLAGTLAAVLWSIVAWWLGLPTSSSHALIGGLVGAVLRASGLEAIRYRGLLKILTALVVSPLLGLAVGYLIMKCILFLAEWFSPRLNTFFKRAQIATSVALALGQGTNDAQKTMGVITLGLVTSGYLKVFRVPLWVIAASAGSISLGIATGGWRLIRTLGSGFYRIRAVHGFSSQLASALMITAAAILGGPVSTTQVISSAIVGVGSAERVSKVRWGMARQIAIAWLLTIPATALLAAVLHWGLSHLSPAR
jgi:PiT family inorganic phosphate transporter